MMHNFMLLRHFLNSTTSKSFNTTLVTSEEGKLEGYDGVGGNPLPEASMAAEKTKVKEGMFGLS